MKIYVELIILINAFYDFLILTSTSLLLKRHTSIKRLLIGTILGIQTIITLFVPLEKIVLLMMKIVTSMVMVTFTFGKRNFFENIFYFYVITIIIGGSEYLITGSNYKINVIGLMIISPVIIGLYIYSERNYKMRVTKLLDVFIIDKESVYELKGYMDTGNTVIDPITKYPVLMINKNIQLSSDKYFYVPIHVVNKDDLIRCVKVDKVIINNKCVDVLLGLCESNIFNGKYDVILNENIRETILC